MTNEKKVCYYTASINIYLYDMSLKAKGNIRK